MEQEAAQWVACRMGDEPFDENSFNAWLAGDPRRKPLFDAMWRRIMGPNMDGALNAYAKRRRSRQALLAGSLAAILALIGGYKAIPSIELLFAQPQDYAAADEDIRQVNLEDGTRLTLASGTEVRVRFTRHARDVELRHGTLFADITHEGRPFRIDTGDARITDLGTRFEVTKKPAAVRVVVESGAVRFGTKNWFGKSIDLNAAQAAVLSGAGLNRIDDVTPDGVARWRNIWAEYRDTPMKQVVADLESVSSLPIEIKDSALAEQRVSGRVRLVEPMRQLQNLSVIHGFSVHKNDNSIVLARN